jgi:predicted nucleic-acid-binding Zn-ribbon protein
MGDDLFSRFKRVNKSREDAGRPLNPGPYLLAGKQITCLHCGEKHFIEGSAQVNTSVKSALLGLDYKKVYTLICTECGYLQWMMMEPHRMMDDSLFT